MGWQEINQTNPLSGKSVQIYLLLMLSELVLKITRYYFWLKKKISNRDRHQVHWPTVPHLEYITRRPILVTPIVSFRPGRGSSHDFSFLQVMFIAYLS